jgi:UDP-N-acetylglucosamine/UDP-N-acetylgalactosamine diphosphorylase
MDEFWLSQKEVDQVRDQWWADWKSRVRTGRDAKEPLLLKAKMDQDLSRDDYARLNSKWKRKSRKAKPQQIAIKKGKPDLILTYHGRIAPLKNLTVFIKTARRLAEYFDRYGKILRVEIIGGDVRNQYYEEYLKLLAEREGVAEIVQFRGPFETNDLPAIYSNGGTEKRIFLFTGENESFGLAPLEALRLGVPVVASTTDSVKEIVYNETKGESSGVLVEVRGLTPDEKARAYYLAVLKLFQDPIRWKYYQETARENSSRFSPASMAAEYDRLFASLSGNPAYSLHYISPGLFPFEQGGVAQWARNLLSQERQIASVRASREIFVTSLEPAGATINDENRRALGPVHFQAVSEKNVAEREVPTREVLENEIKPVFRKLFKRILETPSQGSLSGRLRQSVSTIEDIGLLYETSRIFRKYDYRYILEHVAEEIFMEMIPGFSGKMGSDGWRKFMHDTLFRYCSVLSYNAENQGDVILLDSPHPFSVSGVVSKYYSSAGKWAKPRSLVFVQHSRGTEPFFNKIENDPSLSPLSRQLSEQFFIFFIKLIYVHSDKIVAVSREVGKEVAETYHADPAKVQVILNGIDFTLPDRSKSTSVGLQGAMSPAGQFGPRRLKPADDPKEYGVEEVRLTIKSAIEALKSQKRRGLIHGKIQNIQKAETFEEGGIVYIPEIPSGEMMVIGDVHGDLASVDASLAQYDALKKMEAGRLKLVFLGDYSGGYNAIKLMMRGMNLKIKYPNHVILMRGNHDERETPEILKDIYLWRKKYQAVTGKHLEIFSEEVNKHYPPDVYEDFVRLFELLPTVLVTANGIVVAHAAPPAEPIGSLETLVGNEALFGGIQNNYLVESIAAAEPPKREKVKLVDEEIFDRFMAVAGGSIFVRGHLDKAVPLEFLFHDRVGTIITHGIGSPDAPFYNQVYSVQHIVPRFAVLPLDRKVERFEVSFVHFVKDEFIKQVLASRSELRSPERQVKASVFGRNDQAENGTPSVIASAAAGAAKQSLFGIASSLRLSLAAAARALRRRSELRSITPDGRETLTLRDQQGELKLRILRPLESSKGLLELSEDVSSGRVYVVKRLINEEDIVNGEEVDVMLSLVQEAEHYPYIYHPRVMRAENGKWAGLEDAKAIVYPYEEGQSFYNLITELKKQPLEEYALRWFDLVIKVARVARHLEELGVPGVWDINEKNVIIRPTDQIHLIDYHQPGIDIFVKLAWLMYSPFLDPRSGSFSSKNVISTMKFSGDPSVNEKIQEMLLEIDRRVYAKEYDKIQPFINDLELVRTALEGRPSTIAKPIGEAMSELKRLIADRLRELRSRGETRPLFVVFDGSAGVGKSDLLQYHIKRWPGRLTLISEIGTGKKEGPGSFFKDFRLFKDVAANMLSVGGDVVVLETVNARVFEEEAGLLFDVRVLLTADNETQEHNLREKIDRLGHIPARQYDQTIQELIAKSAPSFPLSRYDIVLDNSIIYRPGEWQIYDLLKKVDQSGRSELRITPVISLLNDLDARYRNAKDKLSQYGEEHLLEYWNELDAVKRTKLLDQIENTDWKLFSHLIETLINNPSHAAQQIGEFKPAVPKRKHAAAKKAGEETLSWKGTGEQAKLGFIIVAGGKGSGLKFEHPKDLYRATPLSGEELYKTIVKKIKALSLHYGHSLPFPIIVMTSADTRDETEAYLDKFLTREERACVFVMDQFVLPEVDMKTKKAFLKSKYEIDVGGAGHGDAFDYMLINPKARQWLEQFGVEYMQYLNVDNDLNPLGDPYFVGEHALSQNEPHSPGRAHISLGMIKKHGSGDRLGNVIVVNGQKESIDYGEASPEILATPYGDPSFRIVTIKTLDGSIPIEFLVAAGKDSDPDWQGVRHKVFKFERSSGNKKRYGAEVYFNRDETFASIKKRDEDAKDETPSTSRKLQSDYWKKRLKAAGYRVARGMMVELPWAAHYMDAGTLAETLGRTSLPKILARILSSHPGESIAGYLIDDAWNWQALSQAEINAKLNRSELRNGLGSRNLVSGIEVGLEQQDLRNISTDQKEKLIEENARDNRVRIYIGTATVADGIVRQANEQYGLANYEDLIVETLNRNNISVHLEYITLPGDASPARHFGSIEFEYYLTVSKADEERVRAFVAEVYKKTAQRYASVYILDAPQDALNEAAAASLTKQMSKASDSEESIETQLARAGIHAEPDEQFAALYRAFHNINPDFDLKLLYEKYLKTKAVLGKFPYAVHEGKDPDEVEIVTHSSDDRLDEPEELRLAIQRTGVQEGERRITVTANHERLTD